jgi:hypothetical protein
MNAKQLATNTLVAIAMATAMPVALAQEAHHDSDRPEASPGLVRDVRQATQGFRDVTAATAAGYVSARNCVSGPNQGAMGVHYVNDGYIADGVLDVQRPEVLVYEPFEGKLRLVAVEYFVDAQQWDAANAAPPVLGGQLFNYVGAPNRLRLPAYYELHVWAWKGNSSGIFSDWNPRVSCAEFAGEQQATGPGH